jgi:hypothetical protein
VALAAFFTAPDLLAGFIEHATADIERFGELAVYDTSLRLGAWLKKSPTLVYLHAGTRKGARALGLDVKRGYLEMKELPKPIRMLKPCEVEDFCRPDSFQRNFGRHRLSGSNIIYHHWG